jgi:hypothetical protein
MGTVLLPPGGYPIAVKYIISYRITCIMKSEAANITLTDQGASSCASRSSAPLISILFGGWKGEEQDTACNRMGKDRRGNRRTTTVQV